MNGQSGQILCQGVLPGDFGRGPIRVPAAFPRYFAHADGTPRLLLNSASARLPCSR